MVIGKITTDKTHRAVTRRLLSFLFHIVSLQTDTEIAENSPISYKKLSYRRGTARCVVSVEILPVATQQCRNYLYDKS